MHGSGLNLSKIENIFPYATITVQFAPKLVGFHSNVPLD
jgi:hypothetical protein